MEELSRGAETREEMVRTMARVTPLVPLLASLACAAPPSSFPHELPASQSAAELRAEHGLDELIALDHPDYPAGFYCAWAARASGDFVHYQIGFYARADDGYRLLDYPHIIGGFGAPRCGEVEQIGKVGAVASSLADGEKIYFFVEEGRLRSRMEHEDAWREVDPEAERRRRQRLVGSD